MIDEATSAFIKDVGFPVAAFVLMLALYIYSSKMYERRQSEDNKRYEVLVDRFIQSVEGISKEQTKALDEMSSLLRLHIQQKEAFIDIIKDMRKENARH